MAVTFLIGVSPSIGNDLHATSPQPSETYITLENESEGVSESYVTGYHGDSEIKIMYPLSGMPAIVTKRGNFTITVKFSESQGKWKCILSTAYDIVWEEISLRVGDVTYNGTSHLWEILVEVPSDADEDLYNITVVVETDGKIFEAREPRAVSVVKEFKNTFSFVHLTDFHIGDPRGMKVDINKTVGWKAAKKSIREINLLNPDFVIITGDLVFGQLYPFEYPIEYKKCYDILQLFQVPTFVCLGNHDGYIQFGQDGFKFWQQLFGPLYYSFDYGDYHFTSVNSYDWPARSRVAFSYLAFNWGGHIREEEMRWIEHDLQNSVNAKLRFVMLHHNPLWDTKNDSLLNNEYEGREELLGLIEKYDVDAVFAGHVHYDNVTVKNGTIYVTTTTVASSLGDEDAYWGYRLIKVNDEKVNSYNYKEPKYSIPLYRLNYTYSRNDGSVTTVTANVENDLEMDVEARLHFYVPAGDYQVENGEIVKENSADEIKKVDVDAFISAMNSVEIVIRPL
ncbi:MAG: metallophosphoesterase [Candidatus Thermoplasmatota archaeon]|nr:metallophosphoesterase [Candidatus Thermoplasmatota archaeon]